MASALLFAYRLASGYTRPAQVDDTTSVYRWLHDQGVEATRVAFAGDSSGGLAIPDEAIRGLADWGGRRDPAIAPSGHGRVAAATAGRPDLP
jgi:hypothetical protein